MAAEPRKDNQESKRKKLKIQLLFHNQEILEQNWSMHIEEFMCDGVGTHLNFLSRQVYS